MRQTVESFEEEWRTNTLRVQYNRKAGKRAWSYGRVCLWVKLVCGHYVQRMVPLSKDGTFKAPARCKCDQCG